jgi:hypothetical protein
MPRISDFAVFADVTHPISNIAGGDPDKDFDATLSDDIGVSSGGVLSCVLTTDPGVNNNNLGKV